ncbi:uncharacterized protein LOC122756655 [Drosophila santomea]|uniref:uncharacterized protein LOC122756509 n=1 Tax=Drosophila santomea TaxID=129105 RepID=UPI001CCEBDA5|nr:uncharacterized protein LOC122756509 [Drosophila santomea]XP_043862806.1 uncharacterized protein LOC122756655 [Drosophila santomea]
MPTTLRTLHVVKLEELPPDALVSGSQDSSSDPSVQSAFPQEQRLHVTDRTSNIRYLIDYGSVVSVVPRTLIKQKTTQAEMTLYAANQTIIHTYGRYITNLDLELRRNFTWPFIIAVVHTPIIGAAFLAEFQLLIDLKHRCLIDSVTGLSTTACLAQAKQTSVSAVQGIYKFRELLQEFVEVTKPSSKHTKQHDVQHHIETYGTTVSDRPRRLSGDKLATAKKEINFLIEHMSSLKKSFVQPTSHGHQKRRFLEGMRRLS